MRDVALAALLELLEQSAETTGEHRAGGGAAENATQRAAQQVAKIAAQSAAVARAGTDIAGLRGGTRGGLRRGRVGAAHVLHRVDREQGQHRLRHRRHALASCLARARTGGRRTHARIVAAAADAVENIEQAHVRPPDLPQPGNSICRPDDGCKTVSAPRLRRES
jgi:hypothetical protein